MRNSFLHPIPELETATNLLDEAVDYLLDADIDAANTCVAQADMPIIWDYYHLITGPTKPVIHWQSKGPDRISKDKRAGSRMPSVPDQNSIFVRDGWRCRFCQVRIISRDARNTLRNHLRIRWNKDKAIECHTALLALAASLDHVVPHSRGGTNDPSNLVSACGPCQFGRSEWTLEEVGFNSPWQRPPIIDEWEGLTRVIRL